MIIINSIAKTLEEMIKALLIVEEPLVIGNNYINSLLISYRS